MGQRHVSDAQRIEIPQQARIVFDRMAALDADQRRNFALPVRRLDLCRSWWRTRNRSGYLATMSVRTVSIIWSARWAAVSSLRVIDAAT